MLTIRLFGSPEILLDHEPVHLPRRKSRALLYYLAAQERPVTRDHLITFFWPDSPRSSALQTLRTTLYSIRKAAGEHLVTDENQVQLNANTEVDVLRFSLGIERAGESIEELQAALDLYRGEFLADFYLEDAPAFEDWMLLQRQYTRQMAVRGFTRLSRLQAARGRYEEAIHAIQQALAHEPLQEDLAREAMRLHHLAGDRPGAIRFYDQFRKLLDEEMGVPPMEETRRLYDDIVNDRLVGPPQPVDAGRPTSRPEPPPLARPEPRFESGRVPFAGRQEELRLLQQHLAAGRLVIIEGEAGIGKTRLAQEFIASLNTIALSGAARELEQGIPYQPVIEALRSLAARPDWTDIAAWIKRSLSPVWMAEISALLPELSGDGAQAPTATESESRLWEAVHRLLLALAEIRQAAPVILFIDDLHWADVSTLGLLGYLSRHTENEPLLLLATARPAAPGAPLRTLIQGLTREGRLGQVTLPRLTAEDIRAISLQLSPDYAYPLADWLTRTSEGNPFVLSELLRYAYEQKILHRPGPDQPAVFNLSALTTMPVVPQTVYSLIQSRLESLSDQAQRILEAAVAVGREFEVDLVLRAASLSETEGLDALEELAQAHIIVPVGESRYAFDHPLTMEVAYREGGEPRHRLFHRRVAGAMEAIYGQKKRQALAGVIAFHYSEGGDDAQAAPYALLAGERASQLAAWNEAADFYRLALRSLEGPERIKALLALGEVTSQAGQAVQAEGPLREALRLAEAAEDEHSASSARLLLGMALLPQARFDEVISIVRPVAERGTTYEKMQAEFLWGTALSLEGDNLDDAALHLRRAEAWYQECHDEGRRMYAHLSQIRFELGGVAAQQGDLEQAVSLYRLAMQAGCEAGDIRGLTYCILGHNNLAYHLLLLGDESAAGYAEKGLQLAEEKGLLGQIPYLRSTLGEIALARGDLVQAQYHFEQGLALAQRLKMSERIAGLVANLGRLAAARHETGLGIHHLSTALAQAEQLGVYHLAAQIRLWLAPFLPESEAQALLESVRHFAQAGKRGYLLRQVNELSARLGLSQQE